VNFIVEKRRKVLGEWLFGEDGLVLVLRDGQAAAGEIGRASGLELERQPPFDAGCGTDCSSAANRAPTPLVRRNPTTPFEVWAEV
jgi:hypothetical protein